MSHHQLACFLAIVLLLVSGSAMAAPSCQNILREMRPCVPYLRRNHHQPSHGCCNGVRYVGRYFNSNRDRRAACECFTTASALSLFGRVQTSVVTSLHGRCHVSIRMPHVSRGHLECSRF
ncbi:hypothetical protein I3843_12G082700 [Carya illinoinensis]|uniref:Bifunctional inhibitor/plant lipid transfer protein/seed storage helical domain-containing protein n=1 Tax=Carya illinoinensis TaxID=32201 RepID=A0A8T1NYT1_CARIL|nr:non-specific lipid-transfer protein-like [Carya illinoinensis]KAG6633937.1 hypothetical protein CIPAW_12G083200 [Carya illinoinensis]KAG6684812.1 hypothetical protein I3842_12G081800 [Carya illinoinensis]KAG7952899.1 hypothetical protein I3843_12G082700 [Carya illinoinensis]